VTKKKHWSRENIKDASSRKGQKRVEFAASLQNEKTGEGEKRFSWQRAPTFSARSPGSDVAINQESLKEAILWAWPWNQTANFDKLELRSISQRRPRRFPWNSLVRLTPFLATSASWKTRQGGLFAQAGCTSGGSGSFARVCTQNGAGRNGPFRSGQLTFGNESMSKASSPKARPAGEDKPDPRLRGKRILPATARDRLKSTETGGTSKGRTPRSAPLHWPKERASW